jgi:hypothetical protein
VREVKWWDSSLHSTKNAHLFCNGWGMVNRHSSSEILDAVPTTYFQDKDYFDKGRQVEIDSPSQHNFVKHHQESTGGASGIIVPPLCLRQISECEVEHAGLH